MNNTSAIISGEYYHVYNRAVGNELLFHTDNDYLKWIDCIKKYILPLSEIHAYCLLPNHYHLLLKIHDTCDGILFSKNMADAANSYAKWFNLIHKRKGSLFMRPFKRIQVTDNNYLLWCLWYIHRNPMHHHYTKNWDEWKYSSYSAYLSGKPSLITTSFMIDVFGGLDVLIKHHSIQAGEEVIRVIGLES
jgi:REP element-mobilizing transposase RayT